MKVNRRKFLEFIGRTTAYLALGIYLSNCEEKEKTNLSYHSNNQRNQSKYESALEKILRTIKEKNVGGHISDFDVEEYAKAIESSLKAHDIDYTKNKNLLALILSITIRETGFRVRPRLAVGLPFLLERENDDTTGPMEVHIAKYARDKGISWEEAKKELQTIQGGMSAGINKLIEIVKIYSPSLEINDRNIEFIIADWMHGEYASRNAALQRKLNNGIGEKIAEDGALLIYTAKIEMVNPSVRHKVRINEKGFVDIEYDKKNGKAYVIGKVGQEEYLVNVPKSKTEKAIENYLKNKGINIPSEQIRIDLAKSRTKEFESTLTYKVLADGLLLPPITPNNPNRKGILKAIGAIFGEASDVRQYMKMFKPIYEQVRTILDMYLK